MTDRDVRRVLSAVRHFAYVPKKTKNGLMVEHPREWLTRGEAARDTLRLTGRYGDGAVVSIDGDLTEGEPVPADQWGRGSTAGA